MQAESSGTKKYSWSVKDGRVYCCASDTDTCTVSKLWEVARLTPIHDAKLQEATQEINAILDGVRQRRRDERRELCLIQVQDRHFLVWSEAGLVGPHDQDKNVRKMLRLKAK